MGREQKWIGVDLDGTLAHYGTFQGMDHIGEPVPLMLTRVMEWLEKGIEVRIMTARVAQPSEDHSIEDATRFIEEWCVRHIGQKLPVTCIKDSGMVELWDDRAIRVIKNTGKITF